MEVYYFGHGCVQIETQGHTLLVDPFISPNPLAAHINVDELRPDFILLTHGHEDHVADAERIAKNSGARLIANFEIVSWYEKKGIEGHPMNIGGVWTFDFGMVKMVNAVHSSVLPDGTYGGSPAGFVITNSDATVYLAGDTALYEDMKMIPEFQYLDLVVLPIGGNFTMDMQDAVLAAGYLECDKALGIHYDTFPYIEIDKEQARKLFESRGIELLLPDIGTSITV